MELRVRRAIAGTLVTLLAAPVAVSATAGGAHAATVTKAQCKGISFVYAIKGVTHSTPVWTAYRVNAQSYAVRTRVTRGSTLSTRHNSDIKTTTNVSAAVTATAKTNAILSEVEVQAKLGADFQKVVSSTSGEDKTVRTSKTSTYPAGTTLITYKARQRITGTYLMSSCERQAHDPVGFGHVVWRTYHWSTYGKTVQAGDWTCKLTAQTPAQRAAQKAVGCYGV